MAVVEKILFRAGPAELVAMVEAADRAREGARLSSDAKWAIAYAGGFADTSGSHYARFRLRLVERFGRGFKRFGYRCRFRLPAGWHDRNTYVRIAGTDNYPSRLPDGTVVGAKDSSEWRNGFTVYGGDDKPRLLVQHQTISEVPTWTGATKLSEEEEYLLEYRFDDGTHSLAVNGVIVDSGTDGYPSTLIEREKWVTRVYCGIDGASGQDSAPMEVWVREFEFFELVDETVPAPEEPPPPTTPTYVTAAAFAETVSMLSTVDANTALALDRAKTEMAADIAEARASAAAAHDLADGLRERWITADHHLGSLEERMVVIENAARATRAQRFGNFKTLATKIVGNWPRD